MKIPFLTAVLILALTLNPAPAQAAWSTPGQTCDREGDLSNSNGFLTCLSGVWAVNPIIAANLAIGTNTPLVSVDLSNKTDALALPVGTTGARPIGGTLVNGEIRYNSTLGTVEAYVNGAWASLLSGSGTGTSIPAAGSTGYVQFNTSNALNADSGFVWDNTNKRLGIGTATPSTLLDLGVFTGTASNTLHIASGTGYDSTLKLMETSDNYGFTIKNSNGSTGLTGLNILRHSNSATGTSALFIGRDTGYVGIGTTVPLALLTVYHPTASVNFGGGNGCGIPGLAFFSTSNPTCGTVPALMVDASNDMIFNVPTSSMYSFRINNAGTPDALHIASNGNVGIGLTTPLWPLHLFSTSATSTTAQANILGTFSSNASGADANIMLSDGVANSARMGMLGGAFYISNNGSEHMRVTNSGNVGIGTTVPTNLLELSSQSGWPGAASISYSSSYYGAWNGYRYRGTAGAPVVVQSGDPIVSYIGGAYDGTSLIEAGKMQIEVDGTPGTGSMPGRIIFATTASGGSAPVERMRISSNGNVGIGTTSMGHPLEVNGSMRSSSSSANVGVAVQYTGTSGRLYNLFSCYNCASGGLGGFEVYDATAGQPRAYIAAGVNGWQTPSDRRLKKDIQTLSVLDKLQGVRGVTYTLKESGNKQIGVIAQEVREAFPDAVTGSETPKTYLGVSYEAIAAIALQGVKELKAAFDADHDELTTLKADNDSLRIRIEALEAANKVPACPVSAPLPALGTALGTQ